MGCNRFGDFIDLDPDPDTINRYTHHWSTPNMVIVGSVHQQSDGH